MPFDVTILSKKIQGIKEAFENGNFADALVGALNTGNGLMQQRVFTQNKDAEGNDFGSYVGKKTIQSKASIKKSIKATTSRTDRKRIRASVGQELTYYQRKRLQKGRQIVKKDLEFNGGLRRSIETQVENEKAVVLEFSTIDSAKIAKGQEQQITNIRNGKPGTTKGTGATRIFTLDEKEREQVTEQGAELIKQILRPS